MQRGHALVTGETYHVFNRGAHKQSLFNTNDDYERFLLLLLISNGIEAVRVSNVLSRQRHRCVIEALENEVMLENERLVEIFAYALMPNHFHLMMRQKADDGITIFLRRLATAYSMTKSAGCVIAVCFSCRAASSRSAPGAG